MSFVFRAPLLFSFVNFDPDVFVQVDELPNKRNDAVKVAVIQMITFFISGLNDVTLLLANAKIGYTRAAGFNGILLAKRENERIITVVFGCRSTTTMIAKISKLTDLGFRKTPSN